MADNRPTYSYTLIEDGRTIEWRPLTAGHELNVMSSYRGPENEHLVGPMLTIARVVRFGDKVATAGGGAMTLADYQALSALDIEELQSEIVRKEAERRALLRKPDPTKGTPIELAEKAIGDALKSMAEALQQSQRALELARAAVASAGPLGK